jgi:acyl-CoA thioester hydrolase
MPDSPIPAPYICERHSVLPDWIDLNGHMNVAYYLTAFDQSFDEAYELIGITAQHLKQEGGSTFAAEMHITYQRELIVGDPLRVASQLVAFDAKRMHWLQCMYHRREGFLAATAEWLVLYIDLGRRRVAPMPDRLQRRLAQIRSVHALLPLPAEAGRRIDITNRRPHAPTPSGGGC